jgi:hypothetical protein
MVANASRFAHERHLQRRQHLGSSTARQTRRAWQGEGVGDTVEIIGHAQIAVIDDVVGAAGLTPPHCRDAGSSQVIGMDVVGPGILIGDQRRQPLLQTLDRQTVGRVDTRGAQDADANTITLAPGTQAALGINASRGTWTLRIARTRLVDQHAGTIAVNPCRTYVNQLPW